MNGEADPQPLLEEIAHLEQQLRDAKLKVTHVDPDLTRDSSPVPHFYEALRSYDSTHSLLLLSDSALPLGSFAYSSGLESYIAHHKPLPISTSQVASFHRFLELSLSSVGGASIPYLLAAFRNPQDLERLDNDLDASTPCTVARRASVAQGRALLSVWERAFRSQTQSTSNSRAAGAAAVVSFANALKTATTRHDGLHVNGHFAPLWGSICLSLGLQERQAAYVFLLNHAKAVLSAAVRASVIGPYQAQGVLASQRLQELIEVCLLRAWNVEAEDAGQIVPALDLWVGRHELLYSRIFNS